MPVTAIIAACTPVLGEQLLEWAFTLPGLPAGDAVELDPGVLTTDTYEEIAEGSEAPGITLRQALERLPDHQRTRLRRFAERLIERCASYQLIVRVLAVKFALHGIAAGLWPVASRWERVLVDGALALGAPGDEPMPQERIAAASVGAVALAVLRTRVARGSVMDEHGLSFQPCGGGPAPSDRRRRPRTARSALIRIGGRVRRRGLRRPGLRSRL